MTTRKSKIPWNSSLGRCYVKDADKFYHHKPDMDDGMRRVPAPRTGSNLAKYEEMKDLLKDKTTMMKIGRDVTRDRMKEMRALERKQKTNKKQRIVKRVRR